MQINLILPNLVNWYFPIVGKKTVLILEKLGHKVLFDPKQSYGGRYELLLGLPATAEKLAKQLVSIYYPVEHPIICPDGDYYHFIEKLLPSTTLAENEVRKLTSIQERLFELNVFLAGNTKLSSIKLPFKKIALMPNSSLKEVLKKTVLINPFNANQVSLLSDVAPLYFDNIVETAKRDFLTHLIQDLKADAFIDTRVIFVEQLKHTAQKHNLPIKILHFTDIIKV